MLAVRGLVKHFGAMVATNQVSLTINHGEIHALIGPNGAGKSTLVHLLSGLFSPDEGVIELEGRSIQHLPMYKRVREGVARSFQLTSIFPEATVQDNLLLAVQAVEKSRVSPFRGAGSDNALLERAEGLARRVGIESDMHRTAGTLPHGVQRALDVALTLASSPKVLLLDEPLAGMGPEDSLKMTELLARLRQDTAMLLIEHDMSAVFRLADRITVLELGQVIVSGTPGEIRSNERVQSVYLGREGAPEA